MINRIRWLQARLRKMSLSEVSWRTGQFFRMQKDSFTRPMMVARKATEIRALLPPLTCTLPITYFKTHMDWRGGEIPWQDPYAMSYTADQHWTRINYRDTNRHGDPKVAWELNRHQFLRHWVLRNDMDLPTRVNAVSHLILDWIEKNPYGYGINWCSSLEVALRLVSWETAIETLGDENFHPRVLRVIHRSAIEHSRHLRRYPSLYSSDNNHRIGELLGEMAAAALRPHEEELFKAAWLAWDEIQREGRLQISPDGVDREQAMYYHAYVMLFLKRAARYAEQLVFPVPLEFRQLLEQMQLFLNVSTDAKKAWFEIGDRDDGDLEALLPWMETNKSVSAAAPDGFFPFHQGGYAVWKTPEYHALFRCGEFGYPSIAAHAHCDQLSVLLKVNGTDVLTDSGTCSYHDNEKWRRYFRGTAAHNTVRINNSDQASYGGPFLWNTAPEAKLELTAPDAAAGIIQYETSSGPVAHHRSIRFEPEKAPFLSVTDDVESIQAAGRIDGELIWNFGPGIELKQLESGDTSSHFSFVIAGKLIEAITLEIITTAPGTAKVYHGDEAMPAGFYSRQFGERIPITQLRIKCTGQTLKFTSAFSRQINP